MINSFQFLKQFDEKLSSSELTQLQKKAMLHSYVDLLLSELEVGDSIEGIISKLGENKYALQVKPNLHIPIHMLEELETGKLMTFVVQGKEEGKLYLKPALGADTHQTPLIQKAVSELNLPKNEVMQEVVDNFLQKQLPLAKEVLLKAYQLHKTYDIPAKVVTNLIEHQGVFLEQTAKTLSELRDTGLNHLISDLKSILLGLESQEDLMKVYDVLKEQGVDKKINAPRESLVAQEKSITTDHKGEKNYNLYDADSSDSLESTAGLKSHDPLQFLGNKDYRPISGEALKKFIGELYDEILYVNTKDIKNAQDESEKIYTTHRILEKLLKTLDKAHLSGEEAEHIQSIKEPLHILAKSNIEAQYFIFPMISDETHSQGELYFFKPKKTHKKDQQNLYIVLSLTFPSIHHIQIHINKQEKNLLLHIEVEDEHVQKHIMQYLPQLNEGISEAGFGLNKVTWSLLGEKKGQPGVEDSLNPSFTHMDFKV